MAKKKDPVAEDSSENQQKKNKSKKTDKPSDVDKDDQLTELSAEEEDSETIEALESELEIANSKADHNWNEYLSAKAELENTRRRLERDIENAHKFAVEKFIQDLLPVIDSMEMGLNAATEEGADLTKLRQGTELTHKIFTDMIAKFGVECIAPEEETFNPEFHQAMSMQESTDVPANTILAVMQKGYLLNGRLIRPAMVIVSKAKPGPIDSNIDNPTETDSLGANIDEKA